MLNQDYKALYLLQDKFLAWWKSMEMPFYLTGGTALGRYYLNHRYSEDLDFFTNANLEYPVFIKKIRDNVTKHFNVDIRNALFTDDFTRLFITFNHQNLKVEFVNDVSYYAGKSLKYDFGWIDTPRNILSNKLTALVGRDEPKDIYDIVHIALNYSFSWDNVFLDAKEKCIINEIDVEKRLTSFPIQLLENINWLDNMIDMDKFSQLKNQIADDFFLGSNNSLGVGKIPIEEAKPIEFY